ncbi:MAG: hypothetical protein HON66_02175 [Formosa sp.]|jgi:hypothetical protein|nr:hypothetical protein [Formosa sp.]MDC3198615.1 hypothetical protein [Flavobacteriaceae bacterium]MDC3350849.1 hypothetical protein [Flavobacteriaceae bacterium]|tara:strand:- start:4570 stop:4890 length:321 start_codon:yes stop_codon:yes gene_type:complete
MTIEQNGTTAVVTQNKTNLIELSKELSGLYDQLKSQDIILHLKDTTSGSIEYFSSLVNNHFTANRCFIFVSAELNQEHFENFIIIPTLQEAYDYIEMEAMQRNLGL